MTALESVQASDAWDSTWCLPLKRLGNNPFIYMAYIDEVLRQNGERLPPTALINYYLQCEVKGKLGLFYRSPSGAGGPTSHDEVMGLFALMSSIKHDPKSTDWESQWAQTIMDRVLFHLDFHLGDFNSHNNPTGWNPFRYNIYRFYWLRPYLATCAGRHTWGTRLLWCLKLALGRKSDANTAVTGPGPRLRNWLMAGHMVDASRTCDKAWSKYSAALTAAGINPQNDLRQEPEGLRNTAFISPYAIGVY